VECKHISTKEMGDAVLTELGRLLVRLVNMPDQLSFCTVKEAGEAGRCQSRAGNIVHPLTRGRHALVLAVLHAGHGGFRRVERRTDAFPDQGLTAPRRGNREFNSPSLSRCYLGVVVLVLHARLQASRTSIHCDETKPGELKWT
jgi:hypothetical protein